MTQNIIIVVSGTEGDLTFEVLSSWEKKKW